MSIIRASKWLSGGGGGGGRGGGGVDQTFYWEKWSIKVEHFSGESKA